MILSKIDNVKPEQKLGNEPQPIVSTSPPAIGNTNVIGSPNELEPVLALITHQGDLGKNEWYEVVYFFQKWCSYAGSKTFEDGEQIVKWKYVKDCL